MITSTRYTNLSVRTYAIEVKAQDSREMMSILKENIAPGIFVPVQLKFINKIAFDNALIYVLQKEDTKWTIVVNHITDGSFFKLEHKIKALLETNHVIHDAIKKTAKVLVNKQNFYEDRKKLKVHLAEWNAELDPDDIRECNIVPEVAHTYRKRQILSIVAVLPISWLLNSVKYASQLATQQKCLVYPMTPSNTISKILNQHFLQIMKYKP
jgi:hypothetical protein